MTNEEKLRETFPKTIFIFRKNENDETTGIMCSSEWLQADYNQMYKDSEPCEDCVSREHLLSGIDELMQSPWFNNGKDDDMITHYGYVERKEAVEIVRDMCIKAESPVTPIPTECEDAISREQAIKQCGFGMTSLHVADCLRRLPSVTPKQRTGKIIMGGYDCNHYICSECSHDFGWFSKPDYKYCPYCGAKMEGGSDKE